jgi:hypothetical protein
MVASCVVVTLAWAEAPDEKAPPMQRKGQMKHGAHHRPLHADMWAQMQAHDARLDELVAAMNSAKGEAKIDAVAAVVNELVAQRQTRRKHLEARHKAGESEPGKQGAGPDTQ